ncbi:MAG: hypothetical protein AAFY56_10450 [Pseudomonadota bacterium]
MLGEILSTYRFQGALGRLPFALGFFALSCAVGFTSWNLRQQWIGLEDGGLTYVSIAWATEVLVALLVLPLCAARLRDIGWPAGLSVLILISPTISPRLWVIFSLVSGGTLSFTRWLPPVFSVISIGLLIGLLLLFLKKGEKRELA